MKITIDKENRYFFGGEVVTGKVKIETNEPITTRSIVILLCAEEKVEITEVSATLKGHHIKPKIKTYKTSRTFINQQAVLLGTAWNNRENGTKLQIPVGTQQFNFGFQLPAITPPSVNQINLGSEYSIIYTLTAYVDSPAFFSFNSKSSVFLPVGGYCVSPVAISSAVEKKPITYRASKAFTFESGRLQLRLTVEQKGQYFGDDVIFTAEITNNSKQNVESISILLNQFVNISAQGVSETDNSTFTLAKKIPFEVVAGSTAPISRQFKVKIPSSSRMFPAIESRLINIVHTYKAVVHVASLFSFNMEVSVPLQIFHKQTHSSSSTATASITHQPGAHTVMGNGKVSQKYSNGDVYDGDWANNKPHGRGVMLYRNGDAFTGEWKNGVIIDGSYSHGDMSADYSSENINKNPLPEMPVAGSAPIDSTTEKQLHGIVTSQFPINASKITNSSMKFEGFVEMAQKVEQPSTQADAIRQFLPLVGILEDTIENTIAENPALFESAVHNHYGVFYLISNYFKPKTVEKWARSCLTSSSDLSRSTLLALLTSVLIKSGESEEVLKNCSELQSLRHISQVADVITSQIMNAIWSMKSNTEMAAQTMEKAYEKAQGGSPLLLAQMLMHLLCALETIERTTNKFVTDDPELREKRDKYTQDLKNIYGEHTGIYNLAIGGLLSLRDKSDYRSLLNCIKTAWELGSLDVLSIVSLSNRFSVLQNNIANLCKEHGWLLRCSGLTMLQMNECLSDISIYGNQLQSLIDWYEEYCEYSSFDGNMNIVLLSFIKFRFYNSQKKNLESVKELETGIMHFYNHYSKVTKHDEDQNGDEDQRKPDPVASPTDAPEIVEAGNEEEVNTVKSEEREVDAEAKNAIQQRMFNRPSAIILSAIRGMCSGLIFLAPKAPRTLKMLRELHACATSWASLGWEPAILFCIFMTQTQVTVAHDLGETSKAISIAKNTLEMIAAHQSGTESEENKETDSTLFEEQDFAFGMLKCGIDCRMYIGQYLDYPLGKYSEAQKWYEELLSIVDSQIGNAPQPSRSTVLSKKDALIWDRRAVALRGIASAVGANDSTREALLDAKAKAEEAIKLGKILKFKENRTKTQENTLARVVKKLGAVQVSSPVSPSSSSSSSSPPQQPASGGAKKPAATPSSTASVQPMLKWIDETTINNCMSCKVLFSFFTRKHHCRTCGNVVCDTCSPKLLLPSYGSSPQRTCPKCAPMAVLNK